MKPDQQEVDLHNLFGGSAVNILDQLTGRINGYNSAIQSAGDFTSGRRVENMRLERVELAEFFLKNRDEIAATIRALTPATDGESKS